MFQFNLYILALFISTLASVVLAYYAFHRKPSAGSRELGFMLLAVAEWSLTAAFEGSTPLLSAKLFWMVVSYLGSQTTAVLFLLFVLRYTQQQERLRPHLKLRAVSWLKAALFVPPAISFLLAATNRWHRWLWPTQTLVHTDWFGVTLIFAHGPWFWVEVGYAYLLLALAMVILVRAVFRFPRLFSLQSRLLLLIPLLPWLLSFLYAFGSGPARMVDLTPVAFTWTGIVLAWSMFHYGFLDLVPFERDQMMDLLQEGILLFDSSQQVVEINQVARRIFGLDAKSRGLPVQTLLSGWPATLTFLDQQTEPSAELRLGERWYLLNLSPWITRQGHCQGSLLTIHDIHERRQAEESLHARERFLSGLNEITRAALEAADLKSTLQALADRMGSLLNADGCHITLWDELNEQAVPQAAFGEMRGEYPKMHANPGERSMTRSVLEAGHALAAEDVFNTPYMSRAIAERYPIRSLLGLPLIAGGRKLGAALLGYNRLRQFTEEEVALGELAAAHISLAILKNHLLHEAQQARWQAEAANLQLQQALIKLEDLATHDPLTGAYNRNKFDELIQYELSRLERYHQPLSLVMFDIDHFKQVNDELGHHTGDQVLAQLAHLIRSNLRETDTLTRWGGEEFLILSPGIEVEQAAALAAKILALVAGHSFPVAGKLTISLGVTEARLGDCLEDLLARADAALYQAKDNGRGRVEVV